MSAPMDLEGQLDSRIARGQELAKQGFFPRVMEAITPSDESKQSIINALLGASAGAGSAQGMIDPFAAMFSGMGAGVQAPVQFQAAQAQLQKAQAQAKMEQMDLIPIEQLAPQLVQEHPEIRGWPLSRVKDIVPLLERHEALKRQLENSYYNVSQAAALAKPGASEKEIEQTRAELLKLYPNGLIPKDYVHTSASLGRSENSVEERAASRELRKFTTQTARETAFVDKFNASQSVKKSQQTLDAVTTLRGLIESDSPISASAIPTYMARASGEVGNLSEADKKPFGGSQAIIERMRASLTQMASGKLTEQNAGFLRGIIGVMEKSSIYNIDRLAKIRAKQYSESSRGMFKEEELYKLVAPDINTTRGPIATSSDIALTGDKAARLAELRKKKAAGTIR